MLREINFWKIQSKNKKTKNFVIEDVIKVEIQNSKLSLRDKI